MEIRVLARQGMSVRSIARELGIARNTVRKYLRGDAVHSPAARAPGRPRKLGPYEDWLRRRVEAAAPVVLPATVLHREIAAMGFDGSERTVRRFVAALRPEAPPEVVERFETATCRLGRRRVYAFSGTLGYSRWLYLEYVDSMAVETLVACHRRMFADFGGIPREILYDNMKTVVTQRDAYGRGRHRFHDAIWMLAGECGYRPRLCRPYRPQTKGKVERSIGYVRHSFFEPLVTRAALDDRVPELDELNAEARLWCASVANVRVHATTGERPADRLAAEQAAMQPCSSPAPAAPGAQRWPRYPLQRSPRTYDVLLQEAGA
jgi:transposase